MRSLRYNRRPPNMDYRDVIKEIGRGKAGVRDLPYTLARSLFGAMLDGELPDLELGAIVLAYRIKGETTIELRAFLDAVQARLTPIRSTRPAVVIPSYNGARHSPNLVALLALTLRDQGIDVLVHGVNQDPKRVTSAEVLAALGHSPCADAHDATQRLATEHLAFISVDSLAAGLARLLDLRWRLGVRGSAHTVCKMIQPLDSPNVAQLVSVTHPEYLAAMRDYFSAYPANVMLMRGTEGEAVANCKRPQLIEWLHGPHRDTLIAAVEGSIASVPPLPASLAAAVTAAWITDVRAGRVPFPAAIAAQVTAMKHILLPVRADGPVAA